MLCGALVCIFFFFFKQKTAYEIKECDWSSDVCSSDLVDRHCEELFLSAAARERDDNLIFVRERLLRSEVDLATLLDLYGKVRSGQPVRPDGADPLLDLLRLSGITRLVGSRLVVRNRIYERVFDRAWVT